MDFLNSAFNFTNDHWQLIVGLPFVALILSAFQEKVNKWFRVQSPKVKLFITIFLSSLPAGIPAILGFIQSNPQFLGAATGAVFMGMTVIYRVLIQPFSVQLSAFKDWKDSRDLIETPVPVVNDNSPQVLAEPSKAAFTPRVFQG
jgi:hypothetical protein